jgi:glucose/arabinose dehydrogenase
MTSTIITRGASLVALLALLVLPAQAQQTPTPQAPTAEQSEQTEAATQAAEDWLVFIDEDAYADSWEAASAMLQDQVTSDKWAQGLAGVEAQTGALNERVLQGARYTTELPNVPEGEYVIVQYTSNFTNVQANEIVVMTREDADWKVAGYLVQPARPQQPAPQGGGGQ